MVHNGRKPGAANPTQICDGECTAFHIGRSQLFIFGLLGNLAQLHGQLDDVLFVHIPDNGNQQSPVRVHGNTDVDVLFIDNFLRGHINAGVELGKDL